MSKIEIDLQKLSALEVEITLLEKRKSVLSSELENIKKEINTLEDNTEKEIAQKKQQCESECQEKINQAKTILKTAEEKLKTAQQRDKDLEVIENQINVLNNKIAGFSLIQKETEDLKSSCLEKEKKAELLIEQYNKKLVELEELKNKK